MQLQSQEQRLLDFVTRTNWILLVCLAVSAFVVLETRFALGILAGGLIVTINFHLLSKTIKKAFALSKKPSHNAIIAKYYVRFFLSAVIILVLVWTKVVDPLGLILGLSVVVASIFMATIGEVKKILLKEAI